MGKTVLDERLATVLHWLEPDAARQVIATHSIAEALSALVVSKDRVFGLTSPDDGLSGRLIE